MALISSSEPQILTRYSTCTLALDAELLARAARLAAVLTVFKSLCKESNFRVRVNHLLGKVTGHSRCAQPVDAWVGMVGNGFGLADSGALQRIYGWLLWNPWPIGFPRFGPGRYRSEWRILYSWRPWPEKLPIIKFPSDGPYHRAIISLFPWLSGREELPSGSLPTPDTKPSLGGLIDPQPAMPDPAQTKKGISPNTNEQTEPGKNIPKKQDEVRQEILDSIKSRMGRLPNDNKEACVKWVQDRLKNLIGTEIPGIGEYDSDWSAYNYRYMFEGVGQVNQSNVNGLASIMAPGAILIWTNDQADNSNGHVAVVERVTKEGVWISDANWDANNDGKKHFRWSTICY